MNRFYIISLIFGAFLFIAVSAPVFGDHVAPFVPVPSSGVAPLTVSFINFSDISDGYTHVRYHWASDDGQTSDEKNPSFTFIQPGAHEVELQVWSNLSTPEELLNSHRYEINVYPIEARFTWVADQDYVPMKIRFIDQTLMTPVIMPDPLQYEWTFEVDGMVIETSSLRNPLITFDDFAIFDNHLKPNQAVDVTLRIFDSDNNLLGSSTDTVEPHIVQTRHRLFPLAGFTYALSDSVGNVTFIDQSQIDPVIAAGYNPQFGYQWEWDFGDGSQNSTVQNPVHTYEESDIYNVIQCAWFVENPNDLGHPDRIRGNCATKPVHVFVEGPKAGLSAIIAMDGEDHTLYMNTLSQPGSSPLATWEWDLTKDGNPVDRSRFTCSGNPLASGEPLFDPVLCKYTLEEYGLYEVTLTVTDAAGNFAHAKETVEYSRTTSVESAVAMFTAAPLVGSAPHTVTFTDLSVGDIETWKWYIENENDDSMEVITEATDLWPHLVHTFTKAGDYKVTLEITTANGIVNRSIPAFVHVRETPVEPAAAMFTAAPLVGSAPHTVTFTDLSVGDIETWKWYIENENDGSTEVITEATDLWPHLVHTFTKAGDYKVTLEITTVNGIINRSIPTFIHVFAEKPKAAISAIIAMDGEDHILYMNSLSQPGSSPLITWEWGLTRDGKPVDLPPDCSGNVVSGEQPILCKYTLEEYGLYEVTLTVTDAAGNSDRAKEIVRYSDTTPVEPAVAMFTAAPLVGSAPHRVTFTDLSVGDIKTWKWYIENVTEGSMEEIRWATDLWPHLVHTFTKAGVYKVTLEITTANGIVNRSIPTFIHVGDPQFIGFPRRGPAPLMVTLTDLSSAGLVTRTWFTDDKELVTDKAVMEHVYNNVGSYNVKLQVCDESYNCAASGEAVGYITVDPPLIHADFDAAPREGPAPLTVSFTDLSTNAVDWNWSFGTPECLPRIGPNPPPCTYENPGTYTVTLQVTDEYGNSDMETKVGYITVTPPVVDELIARFEIDYQRVYPGDKVTFTDTSIGHPIYWEWTFDARRPAVPPDVRGGYEIFVPDMLPERKLTHVYDKPGWYNVTLTVRDGAGNVDTLPWINAVHVMNPQIEADFEFWPCAIPNDCSWPRPHCVRFHDTSRGDAITSWSWDFSNGDIISADDIRAGPDVQSCFAVGDHVVILRVANDLVTDSEYKVVTVPVLVS